MIEDLLELERREGKDSYNPIREAYRELCKDPKFSGLTVIREEMGQTHIEVLDPGSLGVKYQIDFRILNNKFLIKVYKTYETEDDYVGKNIRIYETLRPGLETLETKLLECFNWLMTL